MKVLTELVPVSLNGQTVEQLRVVGWQASYAFYLQGFSDAHVQAYNQFLMNGK